MKKENTASRLREIMETRNLRQVDILNMTRPYCQKYNVKMNKSDISQYCSGKTEPNHNKLFVLGRALNVNEAWLMGYDVPMERTYYKDQNIITFETESENVIKILENAGYIVIFSDTQKDDIFTYEKKLLSSFTQLNDNNKKKSISYTDNLLTNQKMEDELMEIADELSPRFTNVKEAQKYLSQEYLAALKTDNTPLPDSDIIKIANELYKKIKTRSRKREDWFLFLLLQWGTDAAVSVPGNEKDIENIQELNFYREETSGLKISIKRYNKIKNSAIECYQYFNTRNPLTVFNYLNIDYSFIHLEGAIAGFTHNSNSLNNDMPLPFHVYINTRYDIYSQKIIAAHELGHIFIHPKVNLNMLDNSLISDIEEYEANIFAMEFMPHIQPKSRNYLDFSAKELQNYICSKLLLQ